MVRIENYPCVPWHLRLFRKVLGLPASVPPIPPLSILNELKVFIINAKREKAPIAKGIENAQQNGSSELKEYLREHVENRPDHIANALHTALPESDELHDKIERWVSDIFWGQDWEYEKGKTLKALERKSSKEFINEIIGKNSTKPITEGIASLRGDCRKFLEVGIGSGNKLLALAKEQPDVHFYGIDLLLKSVQGLNQIAERLEQKMEQEEKELRNKPVVIQGDMFKMPFEDDVFDMTYNMGVLEHFERQEQLAAIREMSRVTRKGGRLLIGVPNLFSPSKAIQMAITGVDWKNVSNCNSYMLWPFRYEAPMSPGEMRKLCEEAGLSVLGFRGWDPFTKIYERKRSDNYRLVSWDWVNPEKKDHANRWVRIPKSEFAFTRLALFTMAMYYMGWFGERLLVGPGDKLTKNAISNFFGQAFIIRAEKP